AQLFDGIVPTQHDEAAGASAQNALQTVAECRSRCDRGEGGSEALVLASVVSLHWTPEGLVGSRQSRACRGPCSRSWVGDGGSPRGGGTCSRHRQEGRGEVRNFYHRHILGGHVGVGWNQRVCEPQPSGLGEPTAYPCHRPHL